MSGYDLWHRRLSHCPKECIRKTTAHSIGPKDLQSARFDTHEKCPSCMIGKSHLENKPRRKERAENPLGRTNFDIFSSSVVSIEGYNFAVVITDDHTGCRWLYGMKSKDDILKVTKKCTVTLLNSDNCTNWLWL